MATKKTVNLLPAVFQTEPNKKFLNATLDQLTTEPSVKSINGYVGRKFSPGFSGISTYVAENTPLRADYQLEPSIIHRNKETGEVEFFAGYPELLQKLAFYGANVSNHNNFFQSDYYSYNPRINADALLDYGQYYWVPNGPDPVPVFAGEAELTKTFYIFPNPSLDVYYVSGYGNTPNPNIVLVRGGNYQFIINQKGKKFYIQTQPGLTGRSDLTNLSTRDIFGVTNNGTDSGTLYFNVPESIDQDPFINMTVVQTVDLATDISYSNLQGKLLSQVKTDFNGIDGQSTNLNGKFLIFTNNSVNDADWDDGTFVVPQDERFGIWSIILSPVTGGDFMINLVYYRSIPVNNKVIILSGIENGNTEWYTSVAYILTKIPVITAPLNTLYYQDSENENQFGVIRLVDINENNIDIESEILGRSNYVSPNGVTFTNGLKIKFNDKVTPSNYQNKQYYIEGVGTAIKLIAVDDLIANFESVASGYDPETNFVLYANAKLNASKDQLTISTIDFPDGSNLKIGTFPNTLNSNYYSEQNVVVTYPYQAGKNEQGDHDSIKFSSNTIGVTLPGILINGVSNGAYVPGENGTLWHYDTNFIDLIGRDQFGGTVSKSGKYFYTKDDFITANAWGNVTGFTNGSYTHPDGHSKIIGFAEDGYPIYGPYGYVNPDPDDNTFNVKTMVSGYYANISLSKYRPAAIETTITTEIVNSKLITVSSTNGINPGMKISRVNDFSIDNPPIILNNSLKTAVGLQEYLGDFTIILDREVSYPAGTKLRFEFTPGSFIEDMVHQSVVPGEKTYYDLDIYNGRFCKTPEFPKGTYAYFTTNEYPWIIGPKLYGSKTVKINTELYTKDYIVINRASRDLNPWTRINRWFHKSVLEATEKYTNVPQLMLEDFRAKRPIIEFDADIQLNNFGKVGKKPIDIFDIEYTSPFNQVQGQLQGMYINGILLTDGMRIIFSKDDDPRTKGRIWVISFENLDDSGQLKLQLTAPSDSLVNVDESITILNGLIDPLGKNNKGKSFWWDGEIWHEAQQKIANNQPPLFDVFDDNDISFGDLTVYPSIGGSQKFSGTKIFSYRLGQGIQDTNLGFALSYRSLNNIGDIEFENNYETETFEYQIDRVTYQKNVNSGFLHKNNADGTFSKLNVWTNSNSETRQMQDLAFVYNGIDNTFTLDVRPELARQKPNFQVFVNYQQLDTKDYQLFDIPSDQLFLKIKPVLLIEGDRVDVLVYSKDVSKLGYYQIPDNLNLNSQNQKISFPTLGEMRNHVGVLAKNNLLFTGSYPGINNLRDLYIEDLGGTILQQSAPLNYSIMFLCNEEYNFVNALRLAMQEYSKFKNKFLNLISYSNTIDITDPSACVDQIIKEINLIKDQSFPWYYSDMVPYGDDKNVITYTIYNNLQRNYEITSQFSNDEVTSKAILVYLNNNQLLYKQDYEFLSTGSALKLLPTVTLNFNDILTIVEYANTDGNWIPETPTKLGLYPKFTPKIFTDYTYNNGPVTFIQGHDGSLTKAFDDYRDNIILELEKRIYNNIKVSYDEKLIDIYESIPGKFRDTGLKFFNYNKFLGKFFLNWTEINNLNYTDNFTYQKNNAFSFNYGFLSYDVIDNEGLQGSWRSIYQYFYDCQTPHLTPWQMLGFSEEPDWWIDRYGPAPYSSGNTILWTDLQNGYIAEGPRQGTDLKFARPKLLEIIPVNENGELLPPIGLLTQKYNSTFFTASWALGQIGPVENAWRRSSEFPFAIQYVMAMTKPAKYFTYGINTNSYRYNIDLDQYLVKSTNNRLTPADILVNGYSSGGEIQRTTGYLNWISDYKTFNGSLAKDNLRDYIHSHQIQLGYKFGGFTDKNQLKVLAEQNSPGSQNESVIVPDADIDIVLHKSQPLINPRYSAMIIEKVGNFYRINGYDKENPYFRVILNRTGGPSTKLKVLDLSVDWYTETSSITVDYPYGTFINDIQKLADIVNGYEKWLKASGFKFDFFDENLGQIRDWNLSFKEFLFWVQQNWKTGSVITLSPIASVAKFVNLGGFVDGIQNIAYGTKILNQNFQMMDPKNLQIVRDNNNLYIDLNSSTDLIGLIDINIVQYEHVMAVNNRTQFNDIIYDPVSGQRQYRLKLVGTKTGLWNGYLSPPGYIYNDKNVSSWLQNKDYLKGDLVDYKGFYYYAADNLPGADEFSFNSWIPVDKNKMKNGLLPNFSKNAGAANNFYNLDKVNLESEYDQYSYGLIGFRTRDYLTDLGLDDTSQVKFYQGFIKQKGTLNSLSALGNVSFGSQQSSIQINEEWAFRAASYGGVETNQYLELILNENYSQANPTSYQVFSNGTVAYSSINTDSEGLYASGILPFSSPFLLNRNVDSYYSDDIKTSGYVNIEDADHTIFDLNDISNLNEKEFQIGDQSVIWCAKDFNQEWNVFRTSTLACKIISLSNALDTKIKVTTDKNHGLAKDNIVLLKDISRFAGFYKVLSVDTLRSFTIDVKTQTRGFTQSTEDGYISALISLRVDKQSQITSITPSKGWSSNNKVWVNEYNDAGDWAVYEKSEPWTFDYRLMNTNSANNNVFGSSIVIGSNKKFALVGSPGFNSNVGGITNYLSGYNNVLNEENIYTSLVEDTVGMGSSIAAGTSYVAVGAPDSRLWNSVNPDYTTGAVFIYKRLSNGLLSPIQVIPPMPITEPTKLGYSLAMSEDDSWLYIGSPGDNRVWVYKLEQRETASMTITGDGVTTEFDLNFSPEGGPYYPIYVTSASKTYVVAINYSIYGNKINFTVASTPAPGEVISITQSTGYQYYEILTGENNSSFGFSVSCNRDGSVLVVGSPGATVNSNTNAGSITIYNREIENIVLPTADTKYVQFSKSVSQTDKIYIDQVEQSYGIDWEFWSYSQFGGVDNQPNSIGFVKQVDGALEFYAPGAGKVVTAELNRFTKVQDINAEVPVANSQFGYNVEISNDASVIYVGAPFYSDSNYFKGRIYKISNQALTFGNLTSSTVAPYNSINSADSISINNFVINFSSGDVDSIIQAINDKNIKGVTAQKSLDSTGSTYLQVLGDNVKFNLLSNSTTLSDLGLEVYAQVEIIENPNNKSYDYFGKTIKISSDNSTLVTSSDIAASIITTKFDKPKKSLSGNQSVNITNYTTFDADSTRFVEPIEDSGAVWIFTSLYDNRNSIDYPGSTAFVQQIIPEISDSVDLSRFNQFGSAVDIYNDTLLVGAPKNASIGYNTGRVWQFKNLQNKLGWDVIRSKTPRVDIDCLVKAFTYSKQNQIIKDYLDFIDPAKGKILGIAEQEITYKIDLDPAVYNNVNGQPVSILNKLYWSNQQVGQIWWDLNTVRYLDYEQDTIKYRTNNWGRLFPGSSIDVYEWVESNYPPNKYVSNGGNGQPKYPNNEYYVTQTYVDPLTNFTTIKYYFWVKNKSDISVNQFGRTIPTTVIANYIRNPKSSGVKFYAALRDDTVALFNTNNDTSGNDLVFHLDYKTVINDNIIHNEYSLLKENNTNTRDIPKVLIDKMIDSLSGLDKFGNSVPDPALPLQTKLGIQIRPRQSMVNDKNEALKNVIGYVNDLFKIIPITQGFDLTQLKSGEPYPVANSGAYDTTVDVLEELDYINIASLPIGYRVLVLNDSSVDNLWAIYVKDKIVTNWAPNTSYIIGQYVLNDNKTYYVNTAFTSGDTFTTTYLTNYKPVNQWNLIRVQSYSLPEYWQYEDWYLPDYDKTQKPRYTVDTAADLPNLDIVSGDIIKIKNDGTGKWFIIQVDPFIINTVGYQDGTIQFKDSLYNLEDYGLGFGNGNFDADRFDQNPNLEIRKILETLKDNIFVDELSTQFSRLFFVLINYVLNEQKTIDWAFKTSFITAIQRIFAFTQPQIYNNNTQEFYNSYINEAKPYRTTVRESIKNFIGVDNFNGYTTDFDVPPIYDKVLKINRSPSGEFLQDAKYLKLPQYADWLFSYGYSVASVQIINTGSGYTIPPEVTITGSSNQNNAVARAYITNGKVTRIDVLYEGSNYINTPVVTISGGNGSGATARADLKNNLIRKIATTIKYDRITYGTTVLDWKPNTAYELGQILAYNGQAYIVSAQNYITNTSFDLNGLTLYSVDKLLNANDRIQAYYVPEIGSTAKNFGLLQSGIDYPGIQIDGPLFVDSGGFDQAAFDSTFFDPVEINSDGIYEISDNVIDTKITSDYIDTVLGTRPEDIIVDGGPYVYDYFKDWSANTYVDKGDLIKYGNLVYYTVNAHITSNSFSTNNFTIYNIGPYASHAPEELLPGRVFDTLDLKVYTLAVDPESAGYQTWLSTTGFEVDYIVVSDPGLGFSPNTAFVTIDGGGSPTSEAISQVVLDSNGSAVSFVVYNGGSGFTTTPNVNVYGPNTKPISATCVMKLSNAPSASQPYQKLAYRIYKDLNDNVTYLRIDGSCLTTLTQDLNINDSTIHLANTSILPTPGSAGYAPGVIWINGERIIYNHKDDVTNTLGQIRRGTGGTGAKTHYTGNIVYDGSQTQVVLYSADYTWTPTANVSLQTVDYNGLISSFTTNTTLIGSGTQFTLQLSPGSKIYDIYGNLIGTISNIGSNTSANLTANALIGLSNQEYAGFGTFYAGNTYIQSNVWNSGSAITVGTEANVVLATEASDEILMDEPVTFNLFDPLPLFTSNTIQVGFLKQGLID